MRGWGGANSIVYSEFAASYQWIDCHTGLPLVFLAQRISRRFLRQLYGKFALMFVSKKDLPKMWRFIKKYLYYRTYKEQDRIFSDNGFRVVDITYRRRENRLMRDGVGSLRELLNYKFNGKKGDSKHIGIFVKIYLYFHVFRYRLQVNRVVLLIKES
ncbi:MAG: hypothetical protein PUB96_02065 [Helicobacteraceae bacterium]|nr:hypothetical protein [Helicobacteraceae bacterium]